MGSARPPRPRASATGARHYYTDAEEARATVTETGGERRDRGALDGRADLARLPRPDPAAVRALPVDPVYATGDGAYGISPRVGAVARSSRAVAAFVRRDGILSRIVARWVFAHAFEDRERMEAAGAMSAVRCRSNIRAC